MHIHSERSEVTVVIPTRDRLDLLSEAVSSVLAQTRPVDRLVVVDNSRRTAREVEELCFSFGEGRVEYLAPLRDLSMNENHQRALASATTPFICVMQDDDVYAPAFIERGLAALTANPEASIFAVNYSVIDASGNRTSDRAWPAFPAGTLSSADFLSHAIEYMSPVHLSASMFRHDAAISSAFYEGDTTVSDIGFFLRLVCAGPVILVDEPLSSIRVHNDTASASQNWQHTNRAMTTSFLPMEWGVKERFLDSAPAKRVLGDRLKTVRSKGAKRVCNAYVALLRQRDVSVDDRIICAREAARTCYQTWMANRRP